MAEGRSDPARDLGLPYDSVKTQQVKGRIAERWMAKDFGARPHPMSGAGSIKDDASNDTHQFEFKNVQKSHTIKGTDLYQLFVRAVRQGKEPVYAVYFEDVDITIIGTLERGRYKE